MNPPHVAKDPVVVVCPVSRLIREVWLIALYPCIGVSPGKVPVELAQLLYEAIGAQIAIALRVELYDRNERGVYVRCAWHVHLTRYCIYIQHLITRYYIKHIFKFMC